LYAGALLDRAPRAFFGAGAEHHQAADHDADEQEAPEERDAVPMPPKGSPITGRSPSRAG
jgi:hypothetical protein